MTQEKDKRCGTVDEGPELYFTEAPPELFLNLPRPVGYFQHGTDERGTRWYILNRPNWAFRLFMRIAGWKWYAEP